MKPVIIALLKLFVVKDLSPINTFGGCKINEKREGYNVDSSTQTDQESQGTILTIGS
jgi:hypothetical protein